MASTRTAERLERISRREASVLFDVPVAAIDKAIEQRVVRTYRVKGRPTVSVRDAASLMLIRRLGMPVPVKTKRALRDWIARLSDDQSGPVEFPISDLLVVRYSDRERDMVRDAARYALNRGTYIASDPVVKGGEPVIAGTRLTVRAVLARLEGGDTMDDLVADYPDIPREAFETAAIYARGNPPRGRPARPRPAPAA